MTKRKHRSLPRRREEKKEEVVRPPVDLPHDLIRILTFRRPAGGLDESQLIEEYLSPLNVEEDDAGNIIKRIGTAPVMWSCHTDTVHSKAGRQRVHVTRDGMISVITPTSNCLGADDGAGFWLMKRMIEAKVEGLYVFHFGEEIGGIGSKWIAKNNPDLVDEIDYCIALDRKGYGDVITRQLGGQCCSYQFANALADQLGKHWRPDPTGSFTDSASYTNLIPECTNLSVGYFAQHSRHEQQDGAFLLYLLNRLTALDIDALPVHRDPHAPTHTSYSYGRNSSYGHYGWASMYGGAGDDMEYAYSRTEVTEKECELGKEQHHEKTAELIRKNSHAVARYFSDMLIMDYADVAEAIADVQSAVRLPKEEEEE